MKLSGVVAAVSCLVCSTIAATVEIVNPNQNDYWLLEGSKLELKCEYKYTGPQEKIDFYKDGKVIVEGNKEGYNVRTNKRVDGPQELAIVTLTKDVTAAVDSGKYECKLDPATQSDSIDVHIFKVKQKNATLNETLDVPVILQCEVDGITPELRKSMTVTWVHNNATLSSMREDKKYSIFDNGTLKIDKPGRSDMGFYYCNIELKSDPEVHKLTPQPVSLKAGPKVVKSDNPKNMVQGDELELKCEVTGHPFPTVMWLKDGGRFNATNRIHFMEYKGSPTGKVQIYSLDFPDEGEYKCVASAPGFNNATAAMKVTVKDKLAALWPFLGIVAEVVILCVIILLYEKKRSKNMAADDDTQDNNMDNTVDHKEVRHRRS